MANHHFFALISRTKYIRRWGLMRNVAQENVQEHSHMVAVLAHALALIRKECFGEPANPEICAVYALYHDASEIFTGDLPTPVKYFTTHMRAVYREIELASAEKLLDQLPDVLKEAYRPLLREECDETTHRLVKAADKLAAYIKCLEELQSGNTEFRKAAETIKMALIGLGLQEVDYFLEHFMPSFALSLDEQDSAKTWGQSEV